MFTNLKRCLLGKKKQPTDKLHKKGQIKPKK